MNIIESIVSDGHGTCDPTYLAIHSTANPGASAKNHRDLYASGYEYAVQYVGDWTGDVYHCMNDDRLAWAVGNGNKYCVNLEICEGTTQEQFNQTWTMGVEFAAWYLKKRGWTIDNIISHNEARVKWGGTDHTDPDPYFQKWGKTWEQFKADVQAKIQTTEKKYIDYQGLKNCYTYMGWQLITNTSSKQWKLRQDAGTKFDEEGFGRINGYYVIACTTTIGQVGDYIDFTLESGEVLHTIVGDIKSSGDSNWRPYGHYYAPNALSVVEFVVDKNSWYANGVGAHANPGTPSCHPEWAGQIQSYTVLGNFWTGDTPNTDIPSIVVPSNPKNYEYIQGRSGVSFIKCFKFNGFAYVETFYVGSLQADGYIYFNDDQFFKLSENTQRLYTLSSDFRTWTETYILKDLKILDFPIDGVIGILFGAASWSPATPTNRPDIVDNPNGSAINDAIKWMVDIANDNTHGYDQEYRWGPDYDCSSLVYEGFRVGGGFKLPVHEGNTRTMYNDFTQLNFVWHPGNPDPSTLRRGDILWRTGHTEVYIGDRQKVGAHMNEKNAKVGGQTGDQTGHEIDVSAYSGTWEGFFRYGQ